MTELLQQYLPAIISVLGTLGAALVAMLVAVLNANKKKAELKAKTLELEAKKIDLETTIYNGSYIFCPKCGEKIRLGEMEFHIDK